MFRLDARASTDLPATIHCLDPAVEKGEAIVLKQLSLSGALIQGASLNSGLFHLNPELPGVKQVELRGQVVRSFDDYAALHFLTSDVQSLSTLWGAIKKQLLVRQACPYCDDPLVTPGSVCSRCNNNLDFSDQTYLKKHLSKTFSSRTKQQLDQLSLSRVQQLCRLIETESSPNTDWDEHAQIIGRSAEMRQLLDFAREAAQKDDSLLLSGEPGVGKRFIARVIHNLSSRRFHPFIVADAEAMSPKVLEAEVFGYRKGAFRGAEQNRKGMLELADGGTLLLAGVEKYHPGFQARLLDFFEKRVVERLGSKRQHLTNVRIILTAKQDFSAWGADTFISRVQTALSLSSAHIPSLRERGEDSLMLAEFFSEQYGWSNGRLKGFSTAAQEKLCHSRWPRNIDELHNLIKASLDIAKGPLIEVADLGKAGQKIVRDTVVLKEQVSRSQRETVKKVLEENNYVISRAARVLGITRPTLYDLMKKLEIQREK